MPTILFALVLLVAGLLLLFPRGCQAATTVKVVFRENGGGKGTDGCMNALSVMVKKGKSVTLPALPEKTGYISLGWTSVKKGTEVEYQVGEAVPVSTNTVFYAVRQKRAKCRIRFKNNKGTSGGGAYKLLNTTVYAGDPFALPEVPEVEGYTALGWTTTQAGKTPLYLPGTELVINETTYFYAVRQKLSYVSISFFNSAGESAEDYARYNQKVTKGTTVVLPEVEPDPGYTFLGWSKSRGRENNPEYLAGATLSLEQNLNLFPVMFPTAVEVDVQELPVGWQQVYRKIIFVGDSRVNRMKQTLKTAFGLSPNLVEIHYICAEGKGLSWLKSTGMNELKALLGYGVKPAAIIFNLGVNDLSNAKKYVTYLESMKEELKSKNTRLFYMSVNPVSHPLLMKVTTSESALSRTAQKVLAFNKVIRENLCSADDFAYLDIYSYLINTGFRFDGGGKDGKDNQVEDGLHYCGRTYKRIFVKTIALLLSSG